jgi:hypothetical protein
MAHRGAAFHGHNAKSPEAAIIAASFDNTVATSPSENSHHPGFPGAVGELIR